MGNLINNMRRNQWRLFTLFIASLWLSACQPTADQSELKSNPNDPHAAKTALASITFEQPFSQEVYIWQRQWRPANQIALAQSQSAFQGLRILALQAYPKPNGADIWFEVAVNHAWLQADPRPKILVVRLDGQFTHLNDEEVIHKISQVLANWQAKGTHIVGVEIDHDSASSKLPAYREFLKKLKAHLPTQLKLSITALPAWLSSADFPILLTTIDELVLQIHSVSDPRHGLFDEIKGWQWVEQLSRISTVPYLIALPAYGSAVISTASGYRVESETPLRNQLPSATAVKELMADPKVLQTFVQRLQNQTDAKLKGIIWFRLPLEGDKRVWPLNTLIAVAQQGELAAKIELMISSDNNATNQAQLTAENTLKSHKMPQSQLFQLSLINRGNIAGELPVLLSLAGHACSGYDAQNGYRVIQKDGLLTWQSQAETTAALTSIEAAPRTNMMSVLQPNRETQKYMLNPNGQKVIGWARCESLYLQGIYAP
ncbi:DUF3142 domain-containing protein [Shewanella glacialipiscicola]|uniref:DUF3142 domain-containing protein n=1 Tax=Shewanella glacialipiscicola TaxID=614069 RepID=A0ABQ6J7A7_9GAMM|nr:DUF3142 domain-containing protein [Shewanella glacialipiscicola]MCL1086848.1 DUF3142 domain-containing protein [Shewanella glacialipiscicola]GIU08399.1 hypothetical protein TUM4636_13010 [Shewanella glacialipiscicola]GMA83119.1 hypothetical protein GCM10025855_26520 [Shewanella glacialipiscicola]